MEPEDLTTEELRVLKELVQNLSAMSRVKRILTTALLWLSGIVAASWLLWDKVFSNIKWGGQ